MARIATMSRERSYSDGSGPKVRVSFDNTYRLTGPEAYVHILGAGGTAVIDIADIPFVIEALQEAERLAELCEADQ